jgi:TP901 family phage tail tape measure protein
VPEQRIDTIMGGVQDTVRKLRSIRKEAEKPVRVKTIAQKGYSKSLQLQTDLTVKLAAATRELAKKQKEIQELPATTKRGKAKEAREVAGLIKKQVALRHAVQASNKASVDFQQTMVSGSGRVISKLVQTNEVMRAVGRSLEAWRGEAKNLRAAQIRVEQLNTRLREEKTALNAINKELAKQRVFAKDSKQAARNVKTLTKQRERLNAHISNTSRRLKEAIATQSRFYNDAQRKQRGFITNMALANRSIQDMGKRLNVAAQKIVTYRLAFGAWRQLVNTLRSAFTETIKIDAVIQDLKKVMQATEPVFDRLQRGAFQFGVKFGRSVFEVADGFRIFAQQGLSANEILSRMQATMLAVSGSTLTANQAVEALTAVYKNFPELQGRVTDAVDKWTRVAATAPVTAQDLANAVKAVGTAASESGLSLDQLNGIVAAVAEVTRKSGTAIGNSFKTIFARFPRAKTIKALQDLGVLALKDANTMRNFSDVMGDLNKKWDTLTDLQKKNFAQTIAGIRRYNDFLALMKNYDTFIDEVTESQNSFGFAQVAAQAETEKLQRQLQVVQTRFEQLKIAIGDSAIPVLLRFLQSLETGTLSATEHGSSLANLIIGFSKLAFYVGGAFIALNTLGSTLFNVNKALLGTADAATLATTRLGKTATVITGVGRALGSLTLILGLAYAAWTIYNAISDKAAAQTARFTEILEEQRQKLTQYKRELFAARGELGEFERLEKLAEITINIKGISETLRSFKKFEARLERIQQMSQDFDVDTPQGIKTIKGLSELDIATKVSTLVNERFGTSIVDLNRALQELENQKNIQKLSLQVLEANKAYKESTGSLEAYEKAVIAVNVATAEIERSNIIGLISDLSPVIQKLKRDAEGELIDPDKLFDPKTLEQIANAFKNNLSKDAIPESRAALEEYFANLDQELKSATRNVERMAEGFKKATESLDRFRFKDQFTKSAVILGKINHELSTIETSLDVQKNIAILTGKAFDSLSKKTEFYKSKLIEVINLNKKQEADLAKSKLSLSLNNVIGFHKRLVPLLGNEKALQQEIEAIVKEQANTITLIGKEARKRLVDYVLLLTEQKVSAEERNRLEKELLNLLAKQAEKSKERLGKLKTLNVEAEKTKQILSFQKTILDAVGSGYDKLSSRTAITRGQVEEITRAQQAQASLQFSMAILELERLKREKEINDTVQARKDIHDQEVKVHKLINKLSIDQQKIQFKIQAQVLKNIENIKAAVVGATESFISDLPSSLVARKEALDQIQAEEKDALVALRRAREKGDAAATNTAIENLRRIKHERDKLASPITLFEPFLEEVISVRMEALARDIAGAIPGAAVNFMAEGITTASVTGAQLYFDSINLASTIFAEKIQEALLIQDSEKAAEAIKKATDEFTSSTDKATKKNAGNLGSALQAAGLFAAQVMAQSIIGAGGKFASLFANLGGLIGQSALKSMGDLGGLFGGVIGAVGGALLGSLFDTQFKAIDTNSIALEKNTSEIRNNNQLLKLQREFIGAPTRFVPPPATGEGGGGIGNLVINVSLPDASPESADQLIAVISDAYQGGTLLGGNRSRRFSST